MEKIFQNYDFRGYYSLNRQALLRLIEILRQNSGLVAEIKIMWDTIAR